MLAILFIIGMLLVCAGIGTVLLHVIHIELDSNLAEFVYATAIGVIILVLFVFGLGLAGHLYAWAVWAFFGVAGALTLRFSLGWLKQGWQWCRHWSFSAYSPMEKILLGILGVYALLYLVIALAPPTMWDGIHYLFPTAQAYIRRHQIHFIPYVFTMRPKNMVMLYVTSFLLHSDILAVLWNYALTLLCGVLVYTTARQYVARQYALMAAAIFYTMPLTGMIARGSLSESGTVLYGFLAFNAFLRWWRTPGLRWIVLAGIFSGFAAGFKVVAIEAPFVIGVFILGAVWHVKRTRTVRQTCSVIGVSLVVFLISAGGLGSLWYFVSYAWTGHPVYAGGYEDQLLARHFPEKHSREADQQIESSSSSQADRVSPPASSSPHNLLTESRALKSLLSQVKKALSLSGRFGPGDLLVYAWNLSMTRDHQQHIIGPLYLMFVPLGFLGFVRKPLLVFVVYSLLYFSLGVNLWGDYNRYIIPLFPVLAVIIAEVLQNLNKAYGRLGRWSQRVCLLLILIHLPETAHRALNHFPVAAGLVSREAYFERYLPGSVQVASYVNQHLPETAVILMMGEYRLFLYKRETIVGGFLSAVMQYRHFSDLEAAYRRLQRLGVTHVILNHQEGNNSGYNDKSGYVEKFRKQYLQLLYHDADVYLYELKESAMNQYTR
jgi:4-amino-4-deoxy-L-arabinose transferase-like glycosyltransferase